MYADRDTGSLDALQIQSWINNSTYDVRGEIDPTHNGGIDITEKTLASSVVGWKCPGYEDDFENQNCTRLFEVRWLLPLPHGHENDFGDDGHCKDNAQPAVGLLNSFVPVHWDLL